MSLFIHQMCK